jgi:integrase
MLKATSLCQLFIEEMRCDYEQTTLDSKKLAFDHFVEAVGNKLIDRVEASDGQRFKSWGVDRGYSKNSINMWFRSIRRIFNWAVEKELIDVNPLETVKQMKVTHQAVRFYDDDQVGPMLRYARDLRWRAIILAAWTTGFRVGELFNVTRANIRDGCICVEPKGKTAGTWRWECKTKDIRRVPLVDDLAELMERLPCQYPFLRPARWRHLLDLDKRGLLTDRQRKRPEDNYYRTLMTVQRRAFGQKQGTFHEFRKTFVTNLTDRLPLQVVMKLSGHKDERTILTHYAGIRTSMMDEARKIVSDHVKNGHLLESDARKRWAI